MTETLRAFIAFDIPDFLREHVRRLQEKLMARRFPIRWVRPEAVHLTMKFLGNISPSTVQSVGTVLTVMAGDFEPIPLRARGIGVFPNVRNPRVLWVGLCGAVDALAAWHERLNNDLDILGFPKEHRPFRAHVTLGRIQGRITAAAWVDVLKAFEDVASAPFVADRIVLFQSDLRPSGAVYTELVSARLNRKQGTGYMT